MTIAELITLHGVAIQPHEKPWYTPCPYSRDYFLCPIEKRTKCTELVCTDWLRDAHEKEG
jgi:hypothetical protein